MKFKVGDRVKVKGNCKLDGGRRVGLIGIVICVTRGKTYPYCIGLKEGLMFFHANELEKEEQC